MEDQTPPSRPSLTLDERLRTVRETLGNPTTAYPLLIGRLLNLRTMY